MDVREILIANTSTQKRYHLNTDATTLGELKAAMDATDISYTGMSFTEGITKTILTSDDSQLPTNVSYKGQTTNNLVILLTNPTKNIKSGIEERSRIAAYQAINNLGDDVKEEIKETFGRNYTQVPTEALWTFLDNYVESEVEDEKDTVKDNYDDDYWVVNKNICHTIVSLVEEDVFTIDDVIELKDMLEEYINNYNEPSAYKETPHEAEVTDEATNKKIDEILAEL